jgi:hypothetical protein
LGVGGGGGGTRDDDAPDLTGLAPVGGAGGAMEIGGDVWTFAGGDAGCFGMLSGGMDD